MKRPLSPRELLTPYALGLLDPEERGVVESALRSDLALSAEHAEIVRHLALYERFPVAGEPPPFAHLPRLPVPVARTWLRWPAAAAAAILVVSLGIGLALPPGGVGCNVCDESGPSFVQLGEGLRIGGAGTPWGDDIVAEAPAELHLGTRVRAVLDSGSTLRLLSEFEVRLELGRAFFEVGPGPFRVRTEHGDVEVLGTRFEVDVREGLSVIVAEGRVRVGALEVGPGQVLAGDVVVSPATVEAGAFFRRPVLKLEGPGSARPGDAIQLRLVLENATHLEQVVRGPETVATGVLLTLTDLTGREVETRGLDFARALSGGLPALSPVVLRPLERRLTVFQVEIPSAPTGTWRLSALYRPQGEAPIASAPFSLEVR